VTTTEETPSCRSAVGTSTYPYYLSCYKHFLPGRKCAHHATDLGPGSSREAVGSWMTHCEGGLTSLISWGWIGGKPRQVLRWSSRKMNGSFFRECAAVDRLQETAGMALGETTKESRRMTAGIEIDSQIKQGKERRRDGDRRGFMADRSGMESWSNSVVRSEWEGRRRTSGMHVDESGADRVVGKGSLGEPGGECPGRGTGSLDAPSASWTKCCHRGWWPGC
jgi:hypothetical protein